MSAVQVLVSAFDSLCRGGRDNLSLVPETKRLSVEENLNFNNFFKLLLNESFKNESDSVSENKLNAYHAF